MVPPARSRHGARSGLGCSSTRSPTLSLVDRSRHTCAHERPAGASVALLRPLHAAWGQYLTPWTTVGTGAEAAAQTKTDVSTNNARSSQGVESLEQPLDPRRIASRSASEAIMSRSSRSRGSATASASSLCAERGTSLHRPGNPEVSGRTRVDSMVVEGRRRRRETRTSPRARPDPSPPQVAGRRSC